MHVGIKVIIYDKVGTQISLNRLKSCCFSKLST